MAVSGTANNPQYVNYWYYAGAATVDTLRAYSANTNTLGMCFAENVITNVYNSGNRNVDCYVNSILTASQTATTIRTSSVNYNYIGGVPATVPNFFNAQMYYLSIYNTALSNANRLTMEGIGN